MANARQGSMKILFVLHRMTLGGSMTSLLNLLELLKREGYEIDLFLMEHKGELLERAKHASHLLPENPVLVGAFCDKSRLGESFLMFLSRIRYKMLCIPYGSRKAADIVYAGAAKKLAGYDTVVAYQEQRTTNFVSHIAAPNKVAWVHNTYNNISHEYADGEFERLYTLFNHVVCCSKSVADSMTPHIRNNKTAIHLIYNTINTERIIEKSTASVYRFPEFVPQGVIKFVSVGRFADVKKFDRIIKAAAKLKSEGLLFCWVIVGNGETYESIRAARDAAGLREEVILTGVMENPYPVMAASDCLVISSLSEAHPMVAIEALTLGKPVISTAFASVAETVTDGVNGLICENSAEGVTSAAEAVLTCPGLLDRLRRGVSNYHYENDAIISQILDTIL